MPSRTRDQAAFDLARFGDFATVAKGYNHAEHIVISDGQKRIRIDVLSGTLCEGPALIYPRLCGFADIDAKLLTLRRLSFLHRTGRFGLSLYPPHPKQRRWVTALRVHDGLCQGATTRDLAVGLYGQERVRNEWFSGSDSLRSQVRRLVVLAKDMSAGRWRDILL
jgi:Uncharacterized conserved protein (DUF2285)